MGEASADDMLTLLDHEHQRRQERIRAMLVAEGREDIAEWLDGKLRDVRLGLESARGIWHALSRPQKVALAAFARGEWPPNTNHQSVEGLIRRRLVEWRGRPVITEHGRFVAKHGPTQGAPLP